MNSYELSRNFVNFSFENPQKIKPNHYALYFFAIEHCNRLGWKKNFGLPTTMAKEAIGIRSYNTYISTLADLVDWGFIVMIERSKNQYSSNIVALSNYNKALDKALDKAFIKHDTKQSESTVQSIDSIIKQINNKQYNKEQITKLRECLINFKDVKSVSSTISERSDLFYIEVFKFSDKYSQGLLKEFFEYWSEHGAKDKKMRFEKQDSFGIGRRLSTWYKRSDEGKNSSTGKKITFNSPII